MGKEKRTVRRTSVALGFFLTASPTCLPCACCRRVDQARRTSTKESDKVEATKDMRDRTETSYGDVTGKRSRKSEKERTREKQRAAAATEQKRRREERVEGM